MSMARLVVTAVKVEGRTKSEVARCYGLSRYWVQQLVARYDAEGDPGLEPRSRRPHHSPHAVTAELEERIVRLRKELSKEGFDAGADTIRSHLLADADTGPGVGPATSVPATSTIWRVLTRRGFVTPQPHKRPRSSWQRFCAEQPNERVRCSGASRHDPLGARRRHRRGDLERDR